MQLRVPHNTTQALAIEKAQALIAQARPKLAEQAADIKEEWNGNVLNFGFSGQGQRIDGTVTVTDTEYELYVKLPLALRLFEGKIQRMLEAEVHKLKL